MLLRGAAVLGTLSLALGLAPACTTYHDELARGQRAFEVGDHDRTLAVLRDLEPDVKRLTPPEQAEYAYLRGMTDYRVGYKSDARHWLSVARALEESSPGMLPADWKDRTNEAIIALNDVVYTQGTSALPTSRVEEPDAKAIPAPHGKTDAKPETTPDVKLEMKRPSRPAKLEPPKKSSPPASSPETPAAADAGAPKP